MLNPFPIMWLSLLAYFILRIVVGATLLHFGIQHFKHRHALGASFKTFINFLPHFSATTLALLEIIIAGMLIIGWNTQYACLVGIAITLKLLIIRNYISTDLLPTRPYYLLLLGSLLSLFITGAGVFAFDLPL